MDFTLGGDRQALVDVLGRFLGERYSIAKRRDAAWEASGHDNRTWEQLAEIGAIGVLFDPLRGGFGGSPFDVLAVFECLGQALVSEPMLPVLMAGSVLPDSELAAIISGERIVGMALFEPQSRYDWRDIATSASRDGDGWRLDGIKAVVSHVEAADALVVSARDDNGQFGLFMVPLVSPGVVVRGYPTIDGQRAADVRLTGVRLADSARIGGEAEAERAVAVGTLALCAESLGVMTWLKDTTLEYLRTRVQFGAPIGRNQALQHRMAELLIEIEQARSSVINAAAAMTVEPPARAMALAAAKYTIGVTATRVAEEAIQMHGGIGMTEELDMSHYAKRALMIDHQLGDADHHLSHYIALAAA